MKLRTFFTKIEYTSGKNLCLVRFKENSLLGIARKKKNEQIDNMQYNKKQVSDEIKEMFADYKIWKLTSSFSTGQYYLHII